MGRMQIAPITQQDLYQPMDFLSVAGQAALSEVEKAKMKRAREKSVAELKTILDRVKLALDEFATAQAELEISESPPAVEEQQEKCKKKRRKRTKREDKERRKEESGGLETIQEEKETRSSSDTERSDSEGSEGTGSEEEEQETEEEDGKESRPRQPWEKQKTSRKMFQRVSSSAYLSVSIYCTHIAPGPYLSTIKSRL